MRIELSQKARKKLRKLFRKRPGIEVKFDATVERFIENPDHPSLDLHKLSGDDRWSIKVEQNVIITLEYVADGINVVNIGSHDEVY